jgi:hypothetical protein
VRAVVEVLRGQLLERTAAQSQVLDGPGQIAGGRREGQQLAHHLERFPAVPVHVDDSRLNLANHLAV